MMFEEDFLRLTVTFYFLFKKRALQECKFCYPFQSLTYNNVNDRGNFTFRLHFQNYGITSLIILHVVGASQYNYRGYRHIDFFLPYNYLDDIFTFKERLNLRKT